MDKDFKAYSDLGGLSSDPSRPALRPAAPGPLSWEPDRSPASDAADCRQKGETGTLMRCWGDADDAAALGPQI